MTFARLRHGPCSKASVASLARTIVGFIAGGGCAIAAGACAEEECRRTSETFESPLPPVARDAGVLVDSGTIEEWNALSCEAACTRIWPNVMITGCSAGDGLVRCDVEQSGCSPYRVMAGRPARDFVPVTSVSDELAAWFMHQSEIEAASVVSFIDLGRDLRRHAIAGALVREALRCADDEQRHARMMRRLARRAGATRVRLPSARRRRPMSLVDLAIANVAEGCVGELFGAATATWGALHARDPEHRTVLRIIARDESRHAEFALRVERELAPRLGDEARERVANARADAEAVLRESLLASRKLTALGLHPPRAVQESMLAFFAERAWA